MSISVQSPIRCYDEPSTSGLAPCAFVTIPPRMGFPARPPCPSRFVPTVASLSNAPSHANSRSILKLPMAYISGFWFLITLLMPNSGPVNAEWVAIEKQYQSPGRQTVYGDPDTIRRKGNLVMIVQLIDFNNSALDRQTRRSRVRDAHCGVRCDSEDPPADRHGVVQMAIQSLANPWQADRLGAYALVACRRARECQRSQSSNREYASRSLRPACHALMMRFVSSPLHAPLTLLRTLPDRQKICWPQLGTIVSSRLIREPSGADFKRHVNDWNTDARFPDFS